MKSQRLDMIEEYVLEHKNASLDTLCEKFNVSKNTIRRDVDILLKRGSIMKVIWRCRSTRNSTDSSPSVLRRAWRTFS